MTDGTALLLAMTYGFLARGRWKDRPASNLLDGGAPFYGVYRCADGRHVAVGAIEPQFYAVLLRDVGFLGESVEPVEHEVWSERVAVGPAEDQPGERIAGVVVGLGC